MSLNDLVVTGEHSEPNATHLWVKGEGAQCTAYRWKPFLGWNVSAVTCRIGRHELAEIPLTLIDPLRISEFRVQLRGAFSIMPGREEALIGAREVYGGIDIAAREAVKGALIAWNGTGGFAAKLFPPGSPAADPRAVAAALAGLAKIGLVAESAMLEAVEWNQDDRISLQLGPRHIECSDAGAALTVSLKIDLARTADGTATRLVVKDPTAGKDSIRAAVEELAFGRLQGRFTRHQHTFEGGMIESGLRSEIERFCRGRYGREISHFRLDNGIQQAIGPEDRQFVFTRGYHIAANTASLEMVHRCRLRVVDIGRASHDVDARRREVEERIAAAVQAHILSFSESKVLAQLHTFQDTNVNSLSEWAIADPVLTRELAARGLELSYLYIFTNVRKSIPAGRSFRHVTQFPIRGTTRFLELSHDVRWSVGDDRAAQSLFVERGAPTAEMLENDILARELDSQTFGLLMTKNFGTIVFEFFKDQDEAETSLSHHLQDALEAHARTYGVEVMAVTTVFSQIPEAELLKGKMIKVDMRPYDLTERSDRIELGVNVIVGFSAEADGSLLKQHLSGNDPDEMFGKIEKGIGDQIEFFMAGVEPWAIFSMRGERLADDETSIGGQLRKRIDKWLKQTFGLRIINDEFKLQIGASALLTARKAIIGMEGEVVVPATVFSYRMNDMIATEVGIEVGVTIPFRIAAVADGGADGPDYNLRFMEALGPSGDAEHVRHKVCDTIRRSISGLMEVMRYEAFIRSNFSLGSLRELFVDISVYQVRSNLGLEIVISPNCVLPQVNGAVISDEAVSHQNVLRALQDDLAEQEKRRYPDLDLIANYKARIVDKKKEIKQIALEQGVGGTLDNDALEETARNITRYLTVRRIPPTALLNYDPPAASSAPGDAA